MILPVLTIVVASLAGASPANVPTGAALVERASNDLQRLRRALTDALGRVEDARHERDLQKLLCLDEKISQMKVLLTVAEHAEMALAESIVNRDDGAPVEASKIAVARAKADALREGAAACIGQLAYEVDGKTHVAVEEPGDLPAPPVTGAVVRPSRGDAPYWNEFGIPSYARR